METNIVYYRDELSILREYAHEESVDPAYLATAPSLALDEPG